MIRIADRTGRALEALRCVPCSNEREAWCRVYTCRGQHVHLSELSWPLARRLVPRLLARYGIGLAPGVFAGSVVLL